MELNRRSMMMGLGGAALLTPMMAGTAMAQSGRRVFDFYRGDKKIGAQSLTVTRSGAEVRVAVDVDIKVRILGIPAYNYSLSSREVWNGGTLQSLKANGNDNGRKDFVDAARSGGGLTVSASRFSGTVAGNPGTTTYWSQAFLARPTWINTQTGEPMTVAARKLGSTAYPTAGGSVQATSWLAGGDLDTLKLFYDQSGEWVGSEFVARGETVRFVMRQRGTALGPLWVNA